MFPGLEDESPSEINTRLDSLCLSVAEHAFSLAAKAWVIPVADQF